MNTEKVIVTGGAGFIGSHLVDALVAEGHEVHVIDNYAGLPADGRGQGGKKDDRFNAQATYHELDIRDYESILPVFSGALWVFHEAALPRVQFSIENPLESMAVNVTGTANVLRAAQQSKVKRVVSASSGSVYGDQATMPLVETMNPEPKSPYGLHKYMLEQLSKLWSDVYGQETVALRYFNVYGPRMDPEGAYALAIAKFIKQRLEGKPITIWGDGTHSRDFTHVRDIVAANIRAAQSDKVGRGDVINIGAGRNVRVLEVAALLGGPVVHEEERLEPKDSRADNRKAKELLGWSPAISFEDGISELKKIHGLS